MTTPTSDLVERLLKAADLPDTSRVDPLLAKVVHHLADLMSEAAARLTELEAEVSRLREREKVMVEALRPFAEVAKKDIGDDEANADTFKPFTNPRLACAALLTVGDLRRAAAAMEP